MKKRTKRIIIAAIIVAVITSGAVIYGIISSNAANAAKFSETYGTDMATSGNITLTVSGSGNLASANTTIINAATHLDIANVLVSNGDTISAGQPVAILDTEKMQDYADSVKTQITANQNSINTANAKPSSFNITTPVDGWVKIIVLGVGDKIEDSMNTYGYVAVVSTEFKELISAADSGLAEGTKVVVKCEGYKYTGTVVTKNGSLYVSIDTVYRTVGAAASVYDTNGNKLFEGQIQLASYLPIQSNYGTINSVKVYNNKAVSAGDSLYAAEQYSLTIKNLYSDLIKLQEEYKAVEELISAGQITASESGIIENINIADGKTYDEGLALMTLYSPDNWMATISVDEVDINSVQKGQSATVTLDAIAGNTFNGKVERISSVGTASGGVTTYDVDISVESDLKFKVGMSATCEITSQQAENAVIVPLTDVKSINSQSYVMVVVTRTDAEKSEIKDLINKNDYAGLSKYMGSDASTLGITRLTDLVQLLYSEVRAVQTGIQNASFIEIKSGLVAGDKILAQTTDSSSNSDRNFMMGGMVGENPGAFTQRQADGSPQNNTNRG